MILDKDIDFFFSEKRSRKRSRRDKRLRQAREKQRLRQPSSINNTFGTHSKIIDMLSAIKVNDSIFNNGFVHVRVPQVFSIIKSPYEALYEIGKFAKAAREGLIRSVYIDHSELKEYDLAANGLLDVLAVELKLEARRGRTPLRFRGKYPKDPNITRFIRALGIVKHLEVYREYLTLKEASGLIVFDKRKRHYYIDHDPAKADYKTRVVVAFADYVNNCLKASKKELKQEARSQLCDYLGELLDNAEQHSQMADWTIQGYLDCGLDIPSCEITIFNFGKTIAETLKALPLDHYTWGQISKYIKKHKRKKLFSSTWNEENLLTLAALQGGVSSKNRSINDTRGNGTVDLIEFFHKMYVECAKDHGKDSRMALISGGTFILFDGQYLMDTDTKTIAFNKSNDLNEKPDENYVKTLDGLHFPGTLISIRFPLAASSIIAVEVVENEQENDN